MRFHVLTLFPEMIMDGLHTSILGRACEQGHISIDAVNIRDYTENKHKKVDDYPYGGGAGMLMQAQPVFDAYKAVEEKILARNKMASENFIPKMEARNQLQEKNSELEVANSENKNFTKPRVIYLTPQGSVFTQKMAEELAKEEDLVFLCGHYEGIDERVLEEIVTDYVSIGDYVLTGGELPAMVMIDAISRLVPNVLNNDVSAEFESFHDDLLEYPQYSRPEEWHDKKVPEVLLSGHHANIEKWRKEQSIIRTKERRPDLYGKWISKEENQKYLEKLNKQKAKKKLV